MFGDRFFGARFFGARFFGRGAEPVAEPPGKFFGARVFGPHYFGPRYFGTGEGAPIVVPAPPIPDPEPARSRAPLACPTHDDITAQALALLPRGRAWQSNEGGPPPFIDAAFQDDAFQDDAFFADGKPGTILYRFWRAVAAVFEFVNRRWCDLRFEFWCATHRETHDLWMAEYGLPDPCDPFPDLCVKVAALGGNRCDYFNAILARAGWTVDCLDWADGCGAMTGCARAGHARAGVARGARLTLLVHTGDSPAFGAPLRAPPLAGRLRAGMPLACPPDLTPLRCLVDRIAPAHVEIDYVAV